jgi:DNA-binding transcriptional MerR regulator
VENYFNYFTEIEEHYQRRRGTVLLLSTLDWALIETWKDAGIPLEAVLRGIDSAFDSYDRKPPRAKTRKVNSLAYCAQEVLASAEEMKEASVGRSTAVIADAGLGVEEIRQFLKKNSEALSTAKVPTNTRELANECARTLESLASQLQDATSPKLEDLERHLTVMEDKLLASLLTAVPDADLIAVRAEAERDIAPYRQKLGGAQIEQLHRQYVNKRLLERAKLPRLSLFYM